MKLFLGIVLLWVFAGLSGQAQAQNDTSLFENQSKNQFEPLNLAKITKVFPQIMRYGYAGKVLVRFDLNAAGVPHNIQIIETTRETIFDGAAEKLMRKFRFAPGPMRQGLLYEITFCLMGDRITPVLCDIQFERVAGPADPRVTVYSIPYYNSYAVKKAICGAVWVRFDVDAAGRIQNLVILSSSRPGQFEISLKRSLARFRFEKDDPARGIEYKISFSLPGRCRAP